MFLTGCATGAVRFGPEKHRILEESPVYPATLFDIDMISFIFIAFTSEKTSPESVHNESFGCLLGPPLFILGIVDFPISLSTDTVMYPSDLHK